jgi:prevent-host-death family protein
VKIDFKILSMMDLRSTPGEVLDRVSRDGDVFVVERNGQPKACLVPVSFLLPDIAPERITQELTNLNERGEHYRLTINDQKELEISCAEAAAGDPVILTVVMPHGYPNAAPRLYVEKVAEGAPGRWQDGSLAVFGATATWNPKTQGLTHALTLARAWMRSYANWLKGEAWPNGSKPS